MDYDRKVNIEGLISIKFGEFVEYKFKVINELYDYVDIWYIDVKKNK